jgi:hypothetical protein
MPPFWIPSGALDKIVAARLFTVRASSGASARSELLLL